MSSDLSPFGTLTATRPDGGKPQRDRFRIAILGDFSGRAQRGLVEVGEALAGRRAIKLDVDTLDSVIEGFSTTLVLPIGQNEAGIEVELEELEDLEPDELFEELEVFSELAGLRSQLSNPSTAAHAITTAKAWAEAHNKRVHVPKRSGATAIPADKKLSAFQELLGGTVAARPEASPADDIIARVVGPHIVPGTDPEAAALQEIVDEALSETMRLVLHHPDFQAVESLWRSLDLLARRIETDGDIELVLYDISAEEIAADLASTEALEDTGLYQLLSEAADDPRGAFSALFGLYTFEETPPHAHLLGRLARVVGHVDAPIFTAITPTFMETPLKDRHPLVAEAWDALRALPEAAYLGVVTPRFLLRRPYGAKSEPCYEFDFEEFNARDGLRSLPWANPVVAVAILLAATRKKGGKSMSLGDVMSLDDMPYTFFTDQHGDQVALPCTERNLTTMKSETVVARGFMPLVSLKGQNAIRLASFQSLASTEIRGVWSDAPALARSAPTPEAAPPAAGKITEIIPISADVPAEITEAGPTAEAALDDLDDLLADLDTPAEETDALDDLDALLAEFEDTPDSTEDDADDDDSAIDDDLAALLEGL